jgi:toxin ParE1/3/4
LKTYKVRITEDAEQDLIDLFDYIARRDSVENAYHVLDELEELILSLDENPQRGHNPPELDVRGIKDYKEVHFKPYRVIYEIIGTIVVVLGCFDGRRDMQSLLERRLLR